jgi:hypothetical protein
MRKRWLVLMLLGLGLGIKAQSALTIAGTITAAQGSNLQNAVVIGCVLVNNDCDEAKSVVQKLPNGSSAKYQLRQLVAKRQYLLLAWKDRNNNGEVDSGDDLGMYGKNGVAVQVVAPAQNIDIRMAKFSGKIEDLLRQPSASSQRQPSLATTPSSGSATSITITPSSDWVDNQDKSYSARFGTPTPERDAGGLELVVLPSRAKQGNLLGQTENLWLELTQGKFDQPGKRGGRYARRLQNGLNTAITFGSLQLVDLDNSKNKRAVYSAMFLVETNGFVTPMLFVATQIAVPVGYVMDSDIQLALPMIEALMRGIRPNGTVVVPDLYSPADVLGKWKVTSDSSLIGSLYNANTGAYMGVSVNQSAFGMKVSFRRDGTGDYSASLFTTINGVSTSQSENDKNMRWRIVGDRLTLQRPGRNVTSVYVLFGIGKDDKNQPVLLSTLLTGNFTGQLLYGAEDLWLVDK